MGPQGLGFEYLLLRHSWRVPGLAPQTVLKTVAPQGEGFDALTLLHLDSESVRVTDPASKPGGTLGV